MTVSDLKSILDNLPDDLEVKTAIVSDYGNTKTSLNGYYLDTQDTKNVVILTNLPVEPKA